MTIANIKNTAKRVFYGMIAIVTVFAYLPFTASASSITPRKVTIGSSIPNATTSYNFSFTTISATNIQGITFQACANASGTCGTMPAAFSASGSSLAGQTGLGASGTWVVDTSTASTLAIHNATASTTPGAVTVNFNGVHNPSAANATFYIWITTYSTYSGSYSGAIDTGTVATSTAGLVTVNASVDETLSFTLGNTTVSLGGGSTMTTSAAATGTSTMSAATNAKDGYTISYTGATLSGPTTITALPAATTSSPGTKQFGINMALNNGTPNIAGSAAPSGGSGTASAGWYNVANSYRFNTAGEAIASATAPTLTTNYVVSYMANIDAATPAGAYTTAITYTATANY